MIIWAIVIIISACFLLVVFRGAPYVPTHPAWVKRVVALAPMTGTFVDLGSGDGIVLKAAAESGRKALGIEINPFLVIISWLRLYRHRKLIRVRLGDFWLQPLPKDTSAVFVFLAGPFMNKLEGYLQREATRLDRELLLISYGFTIKSLKVVKKQGPVTVQRVSPLYKR